MSAASLRPSVAEEWEGIRPPDVQVWTVEGGTNPLPARGQEPDVPEQRTARAPERDTSGKVGLDLLPLIQQLEVADSGLAYVYWCLGHLMESVPLEDAVLVSDHPGLGRQVFRARALSMADLATIDWWAGPGLYVRPDVLTETDRRAVVALCQVALSMELARHDAAHDALTGLLNRRSFDDALAGLLSNATRYGSQFSLVLLDVDGLKVLNDTAGHWEGDRLLQAAGAELRRSLRAGDFAARLGGDEFGLLLASSVRDAAVRLRDRVAEAVSATLGRPASFSVGVAVAPEESTDATGLYRLADSRLYEDKRKDSEQCA